MDMYYARKARPKVEKDLAWNVYMRGRNSPVNESKLNEAQAKAYARRLNDGTSPSPSPA